MSKRTPSFIRMLVVLTLVIVGATVSSTASAQGADEPQTHGGDEQPQPADPPRGCSSDADGSNVDCPPGGIEARPGGTPAQPADPPRGCSSDADGSNVDCPPGGIEARPGGMPAQPGPADREASNQGGGSVAGDEEVNGSSQAASGAEVGVPGVPSSAGDVRDVPLARTGLEAWLLVLFGGTSIIAGMATRALSHRQSVDS